jgi:hypothetical protein
LALVSWVWLGAPTLDFGLPDPEEVDGERTVWLYADPFRVLGVRASDGESELRRAYRRVAREHHPDLNPGDAEALARFHDMQQAYAAAAGNAEVTVEPIAGEWWSLTGIATPEPRPRATPEPRPRDSLAVAGLTFELRDLDRVPREAEDTVRVTYAGRSLTLGIAYSGSRRAAPVRRARIAAAAESSVLVLLCAALSPVLALVLAADLYVLSDTSDALAWASVVLILGLGYGALAAILAGAGKDVPTPRRAVKRTRAAVAELRELYAGRTRPG